MNRLVSAVLCSVTVASLAAQPQPPLPAFEVASIRPTQSTEEAAFIRQNTGGRFVAELRPRLPTGRQETRTLSTRATT